MSATKPYGQPIGKPDNHAHSYARLRVRPLASAMGSEILGVDLAASTSRLSPTSPTRCLVTR